MSESSCFTATIDLSLKDKLENDLKEQGFTLTEAPYAFFSAKKDGISCNLYLSGKLTVQGKRKKEFIEFYLEPEILRTLSYSHPEIGVDPTARIGLDEAGKGDFFGPLCVSALYAAEGRALELVKLGVRDSKKMSDEKVLNLSKKLKDSFPYKTLRFFPETYNKLYEKFGNLNRMLAWGHSTALEDLSKYTQCKKAILDQFAKEHLMEEFLKKKKLDVDLTQRTHGEDDPVVAAASILARAAFLEGLEQLENQFHIKLPKGVSPAVLSAAKKAIVERGKEILPQISKTHFKTTQELFNA
jgi:ribonuclease HIII